MVAFFEAKRLGRMRGPEGGFSVSVERGHSVIRGASPGLARLCAGFEPHQGESIFFGLPASRAMQQGLVTYVPHRWPTATTTSVRGLVEGAATLAGKRQDVLHALEAFALVEHAKAKVGQLSPALERATAFACGYVAGGKALVFDDPFHDDDGSRPFAMLAERFFRAFANRDWIAFAERTQPHAQWHEGARIFYLHDDELDLKRRTVHYRVETSAAAAPLVEALHAMGEGTARLDTPTRLLVDTTEHVFACAMQVGVLVVRLEAIEVESPG